MAYRGLILDLDNTLYNWVDAFLPSFRAMVHKLAADVAVPEDRVVDAFREVYRHYGTVEYPRAAQELSLWSQLPLSEEERGRLASSAGQVFSINYRQHLRLFPNVEKVLQWTRTEGIIVVGLSDALERWVCYRLRALAIEKYFDGLYTWHREEWFDDRKPQKSSIKSRVQLAASELKPNKEVVERVLLDFDLAREDTFMVGDSLSKDVVPAQEARVNDVWARYGTLPSSRNLATLRRITPWTEEHKAREVLARQSVTPRYVIDDFGQVMDLMGTRRPTLFER